MDSSISVSAKYSYPYLPSIQFYPVSYPRLSPLAQPASTCYQMFWLGLPPHGFVSTPASPKVTALWALRLVGTVSHQITECHWKPLFLWLILLAVSGFSPECQSPLTSTWLPVVPHCILTVPQP